MIRVTSSEVTLTCDTQAEWDAFTAASAEMPVGVTVLEWNATAFVLRVSVDQDFTDQCMTSE